METSGDIDLTSVRAKIKAQDYKAALSELRDLAEDNQNAEVYNLLGFTLRKTVTTRHRFPTTRKRSTCSRTTKLRANILASSTSRLVGWTRRRNSLQR